MARRYTYEIRWVKDGIVRARIEHLGQEWARGFLHRHRTMPGPKLGAQLVRVDTTPLGLDKVLDEVREETEVSIGMVAGFPSAKQYRDAAAKAIRLAWRSGYCAAIEDKRTGDWPAVGEADGCHDPEQYLWEVEQGEPA